MRYVLIFSVEMKVVFSWKTEVQSLKCTLRNPNYGSNHLKNVEKYFETCRPSFMPKHHLRNSCSVFTSFSNRNFRKNQPFQFLKIMNRVFNGQNDFLTAYDVRAKTFSVNLEFSTGYRDLFRIKNFVPKCDFRTFFSKFSQF